MINDKLWSGYNNLIRQKFSDDWHLTHLGNGSLSQFLVQTVPSWKALVILPLSEICTWSLSTSITHFAKARFTKFLEVENHSLI